MIHDHDATKAVIRAGGQPDYPALLALCASHDTLYTEHCAAREQRRAAGLVRSEAKAKSSRANGRKYAGKRRQQATASEAKEA